MHIRRQSRHHIYSDYLILILILGTGFLSFIKSTGVLDKQLLISFITSVAYVLWGIFHHLHEGDLHWKIVVEYTSFAIFGFVALSMLLAILV